MKKIFLPIIACCMWAFFSSQQAQAQQIHQLTHYAVNDLVYNPGVAGSNNLFISKFSYRKQWVGVEGSPSTAFLSIHGNLSQQKRIGLGAVIYTDRTGPTSRTGAQLTYAYHIPLDVVGDTYMGIGIAANLMQYSVNFDQLVLFTEGDPEIGSGTSGKFGADANLGVYVKNPNYFVGVSANQLFASKFDVGSAAAAIQNARHFYLMGGYKFAASESFKIEPAILAKFVKANRPQAELMLRGIYDDQYWLGLSYRTEDALAIMLGVDLAQGFNVTYSYDITTSALNAVSGGSHEITIGYNFYINTGIN